jgi:hypothetical protein
LGLRHHVERKKKSDGKEEEVESEKGSFFSFLPGEDPQKKISAFVP